MDELDDETFYDIDGTDLYDGIDFDILKQDDPFSPRVGKDHIYSNEKMHYVFVYGTMKEGFVNHGRISSRSCNESLGPAYTQDYYLSMFARYSSNKTLAPAVIHSTAGCRIHGELYKVNGWTLNEMDFAEGHPTVYNREETIVSYNSGNSRQVGAWIYVYTGSEDDFLIGHKSVRPINMDSQIKMIERNRAFFGEDG